MHTHTCCCGTHISIVRPPLRITSLFSQILKAFTPVITMSCLYLGNVETPTYNMAASVLLVAAGTAVAAYGEVGHAVLTKWPNLLCFATLWKKHMLC